MAKSLIDDEAVIGLVGPLFSGESEAADPLFDEAGLPMITASATKPTLSEQGWDTFHRILGNDATQGPQVSKVLTEIVKAKKLFVVSDDSRLRPGADGDRQGRPRRRSSPARTRSPPARPTSRPPSPRSWTLDADAVFFGGYYAEARAAHQAAAWRRLRRARSSSPTASRTPSSSRSAGAAAEGTHRDLPLRPWRDDRRSSPTPTGRSSTRSPAPTAPRPTTRPTSSSPASTSGITDREEMNDVRRRLRRRGITKHLKFDEKGESAEIPIWPTRSRTASSSPLEQLA